MTNNYRKAVKNLKIIAEKYNEVCGEKYAIKIIVNKEKNLVTVDNVHGGSTTFCGDMSADDAINFVSRNLTMHICGII